MPDFPQAIRVQYEVYLTSDKAEATFVLSSPRLAGNLKDSQLNDYIESKIPDVIDTLNDMQSVDDFRLMIRTEVECFVQGFHKHSLNNREKYDANVGFRH